MKKRCFYAIIIFLSLHLFSCSQEKAEEGKILARINDYNLTLEEFQYQLAAELRLDKDFKLTKEAKKGILEELIIKELLIQDAKKLNLDRKEKFVRAIELYWESTLIRDLMEIKCKEITQRTCISQEEIEEYYKEMKKSGKKLPPLQELKEKITKECKEKKKTGMLKECINDLRENAKIEINQGLLCKD